MFKDKLHPHLVSSLSAAEIVNPTEIQKVSIPKIKSGANVLCIAPEKSGKTSSIVINVIQRLDRELNDVPRAIILVENDERGLEMVELFKMLGSNTNLRVYCVKPKVSMQKQKEIIYFGMDIVIGTSKQINDLFSFNAININDLKMFIIDDADLVIKSERIVVINRIATSIPKSQQILFAKVETDKISRFIEKYMENVVIVESIV
ncbi:MAG: DEAD/DEAH box helicase [Bacteroidota bacterium]